MSNTILVIDDDGMNLKMADFILNKKAGYEVKQAASGMEGIEILKKEEIALVLLDIEMPEMDGISTLKAIRELNEKNDVPVMFLSASTSEPQEAQDLNVLGLIKKPFLPQDLIDQVEKVIRE